MIGNDLAESINPAQVADNDGASMSSLTGRQESTHHASQVPGRPYPGARPGEMWPPEAAAGHLQESRALQVNILLLQQLKQENRQRELLV